MPQANWSERLGANRAVWGLSAARMGDAVGNSLLMVVLPLVAARLPAPDVRTSETVRVGFLLAAYGITATVVQPLAGWFSDRFHRRKALVELGLIVMAAATLAFCLAGTFLHLLLFRAAQGVGVAITIPAAMAILTTGTRQRTRGASMGIYTTARMAGLAIGPLVGGWLYDRFGADASYFAATSMILLAMLLVQFLVQEPRPFDIGNSRPQNDGHAGREPRTAVAIFDLPLLSLAFATVVMAAAFTMMATLETQFTRRLHENAFTFSLAFSALMLTRLIFQYPLGKLSDRIGRKPLLILGLILLAPSTALLGAADNTLELAGLRLVQGLAAAAIAAPLFALAGDLARPGAEAGELSRVTSGFTLGVALGPLLAGLLATFFFELPFIVGGASALPARPLLPGSRRKAFARTGLDAGWRKLRAAPRRRSIRRPQ